jgi:hypothetical protein
MMTIEVVNNRDALGQEWPSRNGSRHERKR